ncbi:MAG: biotin-dependent carboxyltransferase [Coprothermobacter sp.]|nr:biotin-dependent carboxyltransferase [Coprothermobacter sp.]
MPTFFEVVSPGFLTTVQDSGRFGYRSIGMPVTGALDQYSYKVANLLVGNDENAACLEITLLGPTLKVHGSAVIALTGALFQATLNEQLLPQWQAVEVKENDIITISGAKVGARGYLAVAGGFDVPMVIGSRSTYIRGKIGGFQGRPLQSGDKLEIGSPSKEPLQYVGKLIPMEYVPTYVIDADNDIITLRVIMGPQDDYFSKKGVQNFLNSTYIITADSDRMGYRLEGERIEHISKNHVQIISDGIPLGAVQIPGDGMPIIMLADGQTSGGYPKVATVCSADLPLLAQGKPGDKVQFMAISMEEAVYLLKEQEDRLHKLWLVLSPNASATAKHFRVAVGNRYFDVWVEER